MRLFWLMQGSMVPYLPSAPVLCDWNLNLTLGRASTLVIPRSTRCLHVLWFRVEGLRWFWSKLSTDLLDLPDTGKNRGTLN